MPGPGRLESFVVSRSLKVLLIDSDPARAVQVLNPLAERGYEVHRAGDAREGLERIYRDKPDLVLVTRDLPDLDGLDVCAALKNDLLLRHLPVFVFESGAILEAELAARESGADDCLSYPVDPEVLDGKIQQTFLRGVMGVNRHPVTGLPGFNAVYQRIQETIEADRPFAVCFLNVRNFRHYNRRYGYTRGDDVLRLTAQVVSCALQSRGRELDFLGHTGADDFIFITDPEELEGLLSEILRQFDSSMISLYEPADVRRGCFYWTDRTGKTVRSGLLFLSIAAITDECERPAHVAGMLEQGAELLALAKKSRKSACVRERRRSGKGGYRPASGRAVRESSLFPAQEDNAGLFQEILRTRAVRLVFQPIVYLETGGVFGYEVLLRGPHGTYFESPITLFSMARQMERAHELDLVSLRSLLQAADALPAGARVFFNVSPESFFSPLFRELCCGMGKTLDPGRVVFEVTRKRRILDFRLFRESLSFFRELGIRLALDDAQAGTLSLQTLLELLPDYVKIDLSVTRDIQKEPAKQKVFRRFLDFCERNRLDLIAEGVESQPEKQYLLEAGARLAQGFFFARPRALAG